MTNYKNDFYSDRNHQTRHAAEALLGQTMKLLPGLRSAVDIGCGVGTWLNVLRERGMDILGIDGPWVDRSQLVIPVDHFTQHNFSNGFDLGIKRRFDLAISMEVAEHIAPADAPQFVKLLVKLSDVVLFSAAIPGQGGLGHVNEQWPKYWADLFSRHGYVTKDVLRSHVWADERIPFWYRQNAMLFGTSEALSHVNDADLQAMPIAHPSLLRAHTELFAGQAFKVFLNCLFRGFKRRLHIA